MAGFGLWTFAVGSMHTVHGRRMRRTLVGLSLAAALAGAIGLGCVALDAHNVAVAGSIVFIVTAIPAFWITALAN